MTETMSLGIGPYGYEHVLDKGRQRIVVLDSRGIDTQIDLYGTPIETTEDWYEHVARRRNAGGDGDRGEWRETIHTRVMDAVEKTFV